MHMNPKNMLSAKSKLLNANTRSIILPIAYSVLITIAIMIKPINMFIIIIVIIIY